MSASLCWRLPTKGRTLGDELKYALQKKYGSSFDETLDPGDFSFLEGIKATAKENSELEKDCDTLIDAIAKHESVEVYIEY